VHRNGVLRIQTDIRAGTRTDKVQHFSDKVAKVESILAADAALSVETKSGGAQAEKHDMGENGEDVQGTPIDAEGNEGHVAGDFGSDEARKGKGVGGGKGAAPSAKPTWASILR
jgi:hypothetical protein